MTCRVRSYSREMTIQPVRDIDRWTTDQITPGDRFDYWREVLCANMIGITPEAPREYRLGFSGEVTRTAVGGTGLAQLKMNFSHLATSRTARDIREQPGDGVFLFRATTYDVNFLFDDRENFEAPVGVTVMGGLDRQRHSIAQRPGEYRCDILRLPGDAFKGIVADAPRLEPRIVAHATGADALLHGFFNSFLRQMPRLDTEEATAAIDTLVHLTILALRGGRKAEETVRSAVRTARLQAARDYMSANAANSALSPAYVGAALGISVRQLHALFEAGDVSFSQHLTAERVRLAVHALKFDRQLTVAQVAFESGFDSLPTFYRAFRKFAGMTPSDMRSQVL